MPVRTDRKIVAYINLFCRVSQLPDHNDRTEDTGNQGGNRRTGDAHAKDEDQDRISSDI